MQITATDGVRLAVYESGNPTGPVVVAVHGYPDHSAVWDQVVRRLEPGHRVIRYDVRGAGASGTPADRRGYRLAQLRADFGSVLDACAPGEQVHLLAHDWGSIQAWDWVTDPDISRRISSYSSISGPHLDQAGQWFRAGLRASPRTRMRQLAHSYYLLLFQIPLLPEWAWRHGVVDRLMGGEPAPGGYRHNLADAVNGIGLYRANLLGRRPRNRLRSDVRVQVLAPRSDPFVGVALQTEAPRPYVPDLATRVVPGGHWIQLEQPDLVAEWVADHVAGA